MTENIAWIRFGNLHISDESAEPPGYLQLIAEADRYALVAAQQSGQMITVFMHAYPSEHDWGTDRDSAQVAASQPAGRITVLVNQRGAYTRPVHRALDYRPSRHESKHARR